MARSPAKPEVAAPRPRGRPRKAGTSPPRSKAPRAEAAAAPHPGDDALPPGLDDAVMNKLLQRDHPSALGDGPVTTEATWIRSSGLTPLEFLVETYRNEFMEAKHRVAAAKAVLEYAHKRLPVPLRLGNDPDSPLMPGGLSPDLSRLTDEELAQFTQLVQKLNAGGMTDG